HNELGGPILPCIRVTDDVGYKRYGILAGEEVREGVVKMSGLVEKPGKDNAPSDLASVGGYLLTPDVFDYIERALPTLESSKEFYLTTYVLEPMIRDGKSLFGCALKDSKYYDTGNKLEYLKTVVEFGLKHPELGGDFRQYIQSLYN